MIPNSANLAPIYVERRPDWSQGVVLDMANQTKIQTATSGLEQRTRTRARPIFRLAYVETGLAASELRARQRRTRSEMSNPLLVPFWTERARLISPSTTTAITIDRDPTPDFFATGQHLALETADGALEFREITAVTGRTITTEAGTLSFTTGAKVYPVRLCRRIPGNDGHQHSALDEAAETFSFETL